MAKKKSNQMLILTILLGVFVVLSAMQAVQISSISQKIGSDDFILGNSKQTTSNSDPATYSKSSVPENLEELPQMVGGC